MDIRRLSVIITAFLVPIPIYYSTKLGGLYLYSFDVSVVSVDKRILGQMLPVGIFMFSIYWSINTIRSFKSKSNLLYSFFIALVVFTSLGKITLIYKIILTLGVIFFFCFHDASENKFLAAYSKSYVAGVLFTMFLNLVSFLMITDDIFNFDYARNIVGFEIYGFLVTYSAVASLWIVTSVCFLAQKGRISLVTNTESLIYGFVSLLAIWTIMATARKAAILEFSFVIASWFVLMVTSDWVRLKLTYRHILFLPFLVTLFAVVMFVVSKREATVDSTIDQRIGPYLKVLERVVSSNLSDLMFGFEDGFGGYSNILLEIVARAGIIGLFVYVVVLIGVIYRLFRQLNQGNDYNNIFSKHFVISIAFSFIIGNMANLNISNPYYLMNFFSVLLIFKWSLKHEKI